MYADNVLNGGRYDPPSESLMEEVNRQREREAAVRAVGMFESSFFGTAVSPLGEYGKRFHKKFHHARRVEVLSGHARMGAEARAGSGVVAGGAILAGGIARRPFDLRKFPGVAGRTGGSARCPRGRPVAAGGAGRAGACARSCIRSGAAG